MISQHPFRAVDIENLSELRSGTRQIGVRMMRELVRSSDPASLLEQARRALTELVEEIANVARDDGGPDGRREKAAEFIVQLRARQTPPYSVSEVVDRVAEAAARARYRSRRIVDFLSTWLFALGEQFIANLSDPVTAIELEMAHPQVWGEMRTNLLETLEGGRERLFQGRRFRLADIHLARFRLVRARHDERLRSQLDGTPSQSLISMPANESDVDYVASMVVDLFALSLSDQQQRLIVSQIPSKNSAEGRVGFDAEDFRRLWAPIRAVRTDQAYVRWNRICRELGLHERQAVQEFCTGLRNHLRRTWNWFFPDRGPYGVVRATLHGLEVAHRAEEPGEMDEESIERLFQRYRETLVFIVRLATQDSESAVLDLENDEESGGVL